MKLVSYIDDLREFKPWCGANYNYKLIVESGQSEYFMEFLDKIFPEGLTETELNDLLWFDDELVAEFLGIEEDIPFN